MIHSSSEFITMLSSTPDLRQIPPAQSKLVVAMRVAVMAHGKHQDVKAYLARQLNGDVPGHRFARVMETMGDCWPEPIMVHRPCCHETTYDEMMMLDLVTAVLQNEPEHFNGLLCDMIPERECERLHRAISRFVDFFKKNNAQES